MLSNDGSASPNFANYRSHDKDLKFPPRVGDFFCRVTCKLVENLEKLFEYG